MIFIKVKISLFSDVAFVQVISFPNSHLWLWIGDHEAKMENLVFALGDKREENPKKNILSTRCK